VGDVIVWAKKRKRKGGGGERRGRGYNDMSNGRHACSTKKKSMSKTSSAYCLKKWSKSKSNPKLAFRLVFGKNFCLA
jgi:hypothetical protein